MALTYKNSLVRYRQFLQMNQRSLVWQAGMFTIFSLTLIITLIVFALRPTLVTIAGLLGQIHEQQDLYKKLSDKIVAVQEASNVLQAQQDKIGLIDEALPKDAVWIPWIQSVQLRAETSGVAIQSVSVNGIQVSGEAPPKPLNAPNQVATTKSLLPTGVVGIPFTIRATGSFEQLRDFGAKVENLRRIAMYSQVDISKDKDGTLMGTFTGMVGYANHLLQP